MNIRIYVEGGGDSKELRARCREGFRKLCEKAGFTGHMPAFVAAGPRGQAYDSFKTAIAQADENHHPLLLVDSEEPVAGEDASPDSPAAWAHVQGRDGWDRLAGTANDQAQLMVTCIETWMMADRATLRAFFGAPLGEHVLLPRDSFESRTRHEVQQALELATRECGPRRMYRKGRRSFQLLTQLNPAVLDSQLPHFRRFVDTLHRYLD